MLQPSKHKLNMKVLLCTVNLLQLFLLLDFGTVTSQTTATHGDHNCHKYSASELDTGQCPDEMRAQQMVTPAPTLTNTAPKATAFRDIFISLQDATNQEQTPGFVSFVLISMYKYLHCTSDTDAIADLFYNVSPYRLPDNHSPFWLAAYNSLHNITSTSTGTFGNQAGLIPVVGRRKRQLDAVGALATELTQRIITNAHPSCVQWLIDHFRTFATDQFKAMYPTFPNPNDYPLGTITDAPTNPPHTTHPPHTSHTAHPTTTTTTTTTRAPATTTPTPTTTTTTTTPKPTTTTTTAQPTTTAPPPTTTTPKATEKPPAPTTCFVCNGLNCLIYPEYALKQMCHSDTPICTVHIREGANGRDIDRGCASVKTCIDEQAANVPGCVQLEDIVLPWHTSCRFCCHTENCNKPPLLMPATLWNETST